MKKIEILQTGVRPIIIFDDDQTPLIEYTKSVSSLLKNGNVSILETSSNNIILRPQHIYSIIIGESEIIKEKQINIEDNNIADVVQEYKEDIIIG